MSVELTNMIMITDKDKILIQERVKNWRGYSFPGGHVEDGESFADSAVREAREETGLEVRNLKSCGVIHWARGADRYLAFLYKTSDYGGDLMPESDEGRNLWMRIDELLETPSENGMHEILHMFLHDEYGEAFGTWNDAGEWSINRYI